MPKAKKKEEVPQNVVSIDGSEYEFDSLVDEAKVAISHVAQLEGEMNTLRMKLAQLEAARSVFMQHLKESLPE
jgi:PHD/YefM family antitoxin component YafN of YafNO toxin-antitoxin module